MIYDRRIINRAKEDHHTLKNRPIEEKESQLDTEEKFRFHKELFIVTLFLIIIMFLISEVVTRLMHH